MCLCLCVCVCVCVSACEHAHMYIHASVYLRLCICVYLSGPGQKLPLPEHYSQDLRDTIVKMLTKDPRQRPSAANVLASNVVVQFQNNPQEVSQPSGLTIELHNLFL